MPDNFNNTASTGEGRADITPLNIYDNGSSARSDRPPQTGTANTSIENIPTPVQLPGTQDDLIVIAREYLGLPTPTADLERVSLNPALRGLLNAVRLNPEDPDIVEAWVNTLPGQQLRGQFTAAWGRAVTSLDNGAKVGAETNDTTDDGNTPTKPQLIVTTNRNQVVDAALQIVPKDPDLYLMANVLVHLVQVADDTTTLHGGVKLRKSLGTHLTSPVDEAQLSYYLTRQADICCIKKVRGEPTKIPAHPPDWLLKNLIKFAIRAPIRQLRGVTNAPIIRPDGTIHTTPGYDAVTGYFYAPVDNPPVLPENPTREAARQAADRLFALVDQFPFASAADRAVWLANLLTILARPAIAGSVPGFAYIGNRAGVGKGKLIDACGIITTGRIVPCTSYPENKEEARKTKVALALSATDVVHLDNLDDGSIYGNGVIDSAMTSAKINDRILGGNTMTKNLDLSPCWNLSGNNLSPGKDAFRRWLVSNIISKDENPEERTDLKLKYFLEYVGDHRTELLADALIILKAHALAGRPIGDWGLLGSFEAWDPIVRGAVWWVTNQDCCTTRKAAAQESPERQNKVALLEAWRNLPGGGAGDVITGVTAEAALELATPNYSTTPVKPAKHPDLTAALLRFYPNGKLPSPAELGRLLRSMKECKFNGMHFAVYNTFRHTTLWYVEGKPKEQPQAVH